MAHLANYILETRYLRYEEKTFDDISKRVSNYIGNDDKEKELFTNIMVNKEFVPGGRTIACAGTDKKLIPNCVVLPVEDTLEGIFETLKRAAILQQSGCVIAGTKVLTDKGNVNIEDHVGEILNVWNGKKFTPALFKVTGHNQKVYKVKLNDGRSLTCTRSHKWVLRNKQRVETMELNKNDEVLLSLVHENLTDNMFSSLIGNNIKLNDVAYISGALFGENMSTYLNNQDTNTINIYDIDINTKKMIKYLKKHLDYFVNPNGEWEFTVDDVISAYQPKLPYDKICWLSGIIDYSGNCTSDEIYIDSNDCYKIDTVKRLLLEFGVDAYIENKESWYTIVLNKYQRKWLFTLGLKPKIINRNEHYVYDSQYPKIESIEELPNVADTVYCVTTLDDSHMATFDGIVTGNCGLGFNFSNLRPAGLKCLRTGGAASGPISFMNLYSHAFKIVQQYNRSGANIGVLSINHPDIMAFIHMKDDLNVMNNFNISVLITKEFMDKLKNQPDELWMCKWNNSTVKPRYITYDKDMLVQDISELDITVKEIWEEIVNSAWSTGEPGLLFEHNMNINNPLKSYFGNIDSVNPCGEVGLYPNECCNLGSINLEEFCLVNPNFNSTFDELIKLIHTEKLINVTKIAVVFMNNVIDKLDIPDRELQLFVLILRRLGLGIMGLADMLIKLKVPYNSQIGRNITEYVLSIINTTAHEESEKLAEKYGSVSDRIIHPEKWINITDNDKLILNKLLKNITNKCLLQNDPYLSIHANCACTCIAPTGSTSMIHNVSSGIEPYFALAYKRSLKGQLQDEIVMNKHLEKYLLENDMYKDNIIDGIINIGIENVDDIPNEVKAIYTTAQKMEPEDHVLMQVSAQRHIDNSISKTCNFQHNASKDYVAKIFNEANKGKCKGITVYRDGCRDAQVFVSTEKPTKSLSSDSCSNGTCDL